MFSNLKVNNSDSGNVVMSLKQDNNLSGVKSGSADFYSMVMNYNQEAVRKDNKDSSERNSFSETASAGSLNDRARADERIEKRVEESRIKTEEKPLINSSAERNESSDNTAKIEEKNSKNAEIHSAEKEKKTEPANKEKKKSELDDFINSAAGEMLSKKLAELAKGTVKSNTEDFVTRFRKLADEFLSSGKKKLSAGNEFNFSMAGDKAGMIKENSAPVLTDFFDKLGRELSKIISAKKGDEKKPVFTEKELKETIGAIIDDIKKGKSRTQDKAELRRAEPDEIRNERKQEINADSFIVKKKENGSETGSELNGGKDRNSNRESNSFTSAKGDTVGKTVFEKNDAAMKSPEFRQSLQEIIDKAKISVRDSNNASFSVKLFPKDLGSVNVNLFMENGVVSGRFLVDSDDARNLLLGNLGTLKEQLAEAGIQVGEFNVNVNQGGERFAAKEKDDEKVTAVHKVQSESEAAMNQYDYNSSAAYNGHINMVI